MKKVRVGLVGSGFVSTIHAESLKRVAEGKAGFEQNARVVDPGFVAFSDQDDVDADFAIRPEGAAADDSSAKQQPSSKSTG